VSPGAGSVIALVGECQPTHVLAVASPWIPRGWSVAVGKTVWGAVLIAGPAVLREGHLVAVGSAVADPWGLPGVELDRHVVLERFARYGNQVTQLAAGPFAVADLERASLTAALNGIVPVILSRGARVVVGTHPKMVTALAGSTSSVPIPSGSSASVEGKVTNLAQFGVCESLPLMSLQGLDGEVEHHIRGAGPSRQVRRGVFAAYAQLHLRWIGSALVASPSFRPLQTALDTAVEFQAIRRRVANLWWQAGLRNAALFVPAFERPALDSLSLMVKTN
jgi:hypothetical protein